MYTYIRLRTSPCPPPLPPENFKLDMWYIIRPLDVQISSRLQRAQAHERLDDLIAAGGRVRDGQGSDGPELPGEGQLFRGAVGEFLEAGPLHLLQAFGVEDAVEASLPAALAVPGRRGLAEPEDRRVDEDEHAGRAPEDALDPRRELEVPAREVDRGVDERGETEKRFVAAVQVWEAVVAESRHGSLVRADGHAHERLHVQCPARSEIVDEVQRGLFPW